MHFYFSTTLACRIYSTLNFYSSIEVFIAPLAIKDRAKIGPPVKNERIPHDRTLIKITQTKGKLLANQAMPLTIAPSMNKPRSKLPMNVNNIRNVFILNYSTVFE
jgi:hypothetical protein